MLLTLSLAVLAQAAAPQPGRAACTLTQPSHCRTTNQLVWSRGFDRALERFTGAARGSYLWPDGSLADQLGEALGGPPDEPRRLSSGDWLFSACRAHSCPEKAAIVVNRQGRIIAAGLLNFRCGRGPDQCRATNWTLDLFLQSPAVPPAEALRAWASRIEAEAPTTILGRDRIERTQVHVLAPRRPSRRAR